MLFLILPQFLFLYQILFKIRVTVGNASFLLIIFNLCFISVIPTLLHFFIILYSKIIIHLANLLIPIYSSPTSKQELGQ